MPPDPYSQFQNSVADLRTILWLTIEQRPAPVAVAALLETALNAGLASLGCFY